MTYQYADVAVVGGGMVGGALALGLSQQGLKVIVIEQTEPPVFNYSQEPSLRVSAINVASIDFLRGLGVWENILTMRAHPYRQLEVWSWDNAYIRFDAKELKLPLLGYMVENNILQLALWHALKNQSDITLCVPASLKALHKNNNRYLITLNNDETLIVKLVVGADGEKSQVRHIAGIGIHAWQYKQSCILIIVKCNNKPGDSTWQHFTSNGTHAFLPLFKEWAVLVWYDSPARVRQLHKMPLAYLKQEINDHFPSRLGKVSPVASDIFSLTRRHALKYVSDGLALVGDAAHTIHPVIGQGVNLGYRDVTVLLEILANARNHGEVWSSNKVLKRYQMKRMIDNLIMQFGADFFCTGFNNDLSLVRMFFNVGLMVAERTNTLKRQILKYALGL